MVMHDLLGPAVPEAVPEVVTELGPSLDLTPALTSALTPAPAARPRSEATMRHLLRSAVALQAEGLLRTIGALAVAGLFDHVLDSEQLGRLEHELRDLVALATSAVAAGAGLPPGLDAGSGDPDDPDSIAEGLLASHQASAGVLAELLDALPGPPDASQLLIARALAWHEEEACVLRAGGALGRLPDEPVSIRGRPRDPRRHTELLG